MNGSAGTYSLRCFQILIGSVDPDVLKIPARRAEYSLTESTLSPFQAEPAQSGCREFVSESTIQFFSTESSPPGEGPAPSGTYPRSGRKK